MVPDRNLDTYRAICHTFGLLGREYMAYTVQIGAMEIVADTGLLHTVDVRYRAQIDLLFCQWISVLVKTAYLAFFDGNLATSRKVRRRVCTRMDDV